MSKVDKNTQLSRGQVSRTKGRVNRLDVRQDKGNS